MNKYQKAFLEIGNQYDGKIKLKYMNDISILVERATSIKPKNIKKIGHGGFLIGNCPICGQSITNAISFCIKDGQALNWTE